MSSAMHPANHAFVVMTKNALGTICDCSPVIITAKLDLQQLNSLRANVFCTITALHELQKRIAATLQERGE